ncbi:MAG: endonuclease III [Acidobacteriota bacterium]
MDKPRVKRILSLLEREYPRPRCALRFDNPLELLIATILSAQCTDARVNEVTASLFRLHRTARDYAELPLSQLEEEIRPTGFFRNKAKAIRSCCAVIVRDHTGEVPSTMDELVKLPGVGRKTANMVLAEAFGIPGLVVDTHVSRLARRLGLTQTTQPHQIEQDLMQIMPPDQWNTFSLRLIHHGRAVCKARRPHCERCALVRSCPEGLARI